MRGAAAIGVNAGVDASEIRVVRVRRPHEWSCPSYGCDDDVDVVGQLLHLSKRPRQ